MLWLIFLVVVFALLTAPVSRPGICSFLFFVVIVDQFSIVTVACESPKKRVFSINTALNISLSVETAINIRNSFGSVNLAVFARSISFILAGYSTNYNIYSPL
jgi:hypothetical protein